MGDENVKEEHEESEQQLVEAVFKKPRVVLHRADVSVDLYPKQQEWRSLVTQQEPGASRIKKEEEPELPHVKEEVMPQFPHIKEEEEDEEEEEPEAPHLHEKQETETTTSPLTGIIHFSKFSQLDRRSKLDLIQKGRPTPELTDLSQTCGSNLTRHFKSEWYKRKDWLCGCPRRNRLFCFPCLLFSTCENMWTKTGYWDMKNLPRSLSQHERSTSHIRSQIAWKTFGASRIDLALDEQRRLNVSIHNAKVKENRELLKYLICIICFLAQQELTLRGHDANASYGNYVQLVHAFAEKDAKLARLLKKSAFNGFSDRIEKNLIEAVADVIRSDVKKEMKGVPFVAVQVDETTDVSNRAHLSVILRYVAQSEAKEAFLGFDDMSGDRPVPAVAEYVLGLLDEYECVDKLVAQTYDGAAVRASELNAVQEKIKEKAPEAMLTHCWAHDLNLLLLHSAKWLRACRAFWKTAEGLGTFFSQSTKRGNLLDDVVKRRLPRAAPTRWSSDSRLLRDISAHQADLRAAFRVMSQHPDSWDSETLMAASGYDRWLSKASTCFLMMLYEGIFEETDALFKLLENKAVDIGRCCTRIQDTMEALERMSLEYHTFHKRFEQKCATLGLTDSKSETSTRSVREERKQVYYDVLDNVTFQMRSRFQCFDQLAFYDFVDCSKFEQMSQNFEDAKLQRLFKYARFFDLVRLKADLLGLYGSKTVRNQCKSPGQLLRFLTDKALVQTVPEATKLLQLVLTVPLAATESAERSTSTLKRLQAFFCNRTDQGSQSALAIISVEKERLVKLKEQKEDFYKCVTEKFVQMERHPDFVYM